MKTKLFLLVFLFPLFITPIPCQASINRQKTTNINRLDLDPSMSVQVSTYVGGYLFDLQGLTSPWAQVEFYSTQGNISITTLANDQGIFHFSNVLTPAYTGDFCFLAIDTNKQANNPLCFSAPPKNTKTIIKDIVLSPSLTIEKGKFKQNQEISASGKTFPQAEIRVFMFQQNLPFWRNLLDVYAREGPQLEISSDHKGSFSFNLPTHQSGQWRMFVGPKYQNKGFSAKSNTLNFKALTWWQWMLLTATIWINKLLKEVFEFLFSWKILILILLTSLGILIYKLIKEKKVSLLNTDKSA